MRIAIASRLLDEIFAHAAREPGREACGLLFGEAGRITAASPAANVAPDPRDSFEIDPAALFAAQRAARAGGPVPVGHYHSHPGGDPRPSPRDAAAAFEAGRLWLIVAGREAALWRSMEDGPVEGRFAPVTMAVG